jgi:exonuclease SbcC
MIADGEEFAEFTFIADGHEWTVTRTWNRTSTPGINKLKRSDGAEVVDGSGPVTSRITELLGLDHSQFTQAVVIPQGRFDELLRATPAQRNKLLTSILGLDEVRKVGVVADALRNDLRPELAARQSRRELLPADPVAELTRATTGALDARTRADALQRAVADLGDSDARIAALDAAAIAVTDACDRVPADAGEVDALVRAATDADRLAERRVAAETRARRTE